MTHEEWLIYLKQTYDKFDSGMTWIFWNNISNEHAFKSCILNDNNKWFLMELIVRA